MNLSWPPQTIRTSMEGMSSSQAGGRGYLGAHNWILPALAWLEAWSCQMINQLTATVTKLPYQNSGARKALQNWSALRLLKGEGAPLVHPARIIRPTIAAPKAPLLLSCPHTPESRLCCPPSYFFAFNNLFSFSGLCYHLGHYFFPLPILLHPSRCRSLSDRRRNDPRRL